MFRMHCWHPLCTGAPHYVLETGGRGSWEEGTLRWGGSGQEDKDISEGFFSRFPGNWREFSEDDRNVLELKPPRNDGACQDNPDADAERVVPQSDDNAELGQKKKRQHMNATYPVVKR
jgi:hypothetical protein